MNLVSASLLQMKLCAAKTPITLDCNVFVIAQPTHLILSVPKENVAPQLCLKLPWRHQNNVTVSYPDASFHFPANSAESLFAVLAVHHDSVSPEHLHRYAQHIVAGRKNHLFTICFVRDFSFTHLSTHYPRLLRRALN